MDTACINWTKYLNKKGYGKRKYKKRDWLAHRAAWDELVGPIPIGKYVLHKCDNPACVNVEHLFLGSIADNNRDMISKGRNNFFGAKKLNADDVSYIRNSTESRKELAAKFNVTVGSITNIRRHHTWKEKSIDAVV